MSDATDECGWCNRIAFMERLDAAQRANSEKPGGGGEGPSKGRSGLGGGRDDLQGLTQFLPCQWTGYSLWLDRDNE